MNSVILRRPSEICKSNVISYDVTLRGRQHAGKYTTFGQMDNMAECIRACCMERYCDLAFMINGTCFTVRCHTEEACEEVRSPGSRYTPMISYVVRERQREDNKKQRQGQLHLKPKHHHTGTHIEKLI